MASYKRSQWYTCNTEKKVETMYPVFVTYQVCVFDSILICISNDMIWHCFKLWQDYSCFDRYIKRSKFILPTCTWGQAMGFWRDTIEFQIYTGCQATFLHVQTRSTHGGTTAIWKANWTNASWSQEEGTPIFHHFLVLPKSVINNLDFHVSLCEMCHDP